MRRIGLTVIALLVPLVAAARWQVFSVPGGGTGTTVWIADGGSFAVATDRGAYLVEADGGISQRIEIDAGSPLPMQDAFVDARGCFAAMPKNAAQTSLVYADPACGETSTTVNAIVVSQPGVRMRRAHEGPVYLVASDNARQSLFFHVAADGIPHDGFTALTGPVSPTGPTKALGVLHGPGGDIAIAGVNALNPPLAYVVDAGTPAFATFATSEQVPASIAPIDSATTMLTDPSHELVRVGSLGTSAPTWEVVAGVAPAQAVGFAPNSDQNDIGLGMAGSSTAGAAFQFSVPIANAPGTQWQANTASVTYSGVPQDVDCVSSGTCAAVTDAVDAGNLVVYSNESAPTWTPPTVLWTDAGTNVPIAVSATDSDGDPLAVEWSVQSPLTVTPQDAGLTATVDVPATATSCSQPYQEYALSGTLTDGLASHRDARQIAVRVLRVFSPISAAVAVLDAGYDATNGALQGVVDATQLNCPVERGLSASVSRSVNGADGGTQLVGSIPGAFSFTRSGCLAETDTVTATLIDGDGGTGPSATSTFTLPAQPAAVSGVSGGPLVARCGAGATGTLSAVAPAGTCPTQTISWAQRSGPPVAFANASGGEVSVSTQDTALETLIGSTVELDVTANAGSGTASTTAAIPITADPFIVTQTEVEAPTAQSDTPFGIRVTVENPTACPLSSASVSETVGDAELVPGSARIDGRAAEAHLEGDQVVVDGIPLGVGERHQVTFDVRPHVLGRPSPQAMVVFRGVPISQNSALEPLPTSIGCSCRTASVGPEAFTYLLFVGIVILRRRRHATSGGFGRKS